MLLFPGRVANYIDQKDPSPSFPLQLDRKTEAKTSMFPFGTNRKRLDGLLLAITSETHRPICDEFQKAHGLASVWDPYASPQVDASYAGWEQSSPGMLYEDPKAYNVSMDAKETVRDINFTGNICNTFYGWIHGGRCLDNETM
jgi:hypothetical protein